MDHLNALLEAEMTSGRTVFVGFDFGFGYPQGFAEALTGRAEALAIWDWLEARIEDKADNQNNRFEVAAEMNRSFAGIGPFWGAPPQLSLPGLPHKGSARHSHGLAEHRQTEIAANAQSPWKLYTTGAVGSQSLLGLPYLSRLRKRLGKRCQVWPMEGLELRNSSAVILAEIYPSFLTKKADLEKLNMCWPDQGYNIIDAGQVRGCCDRLEKLFRSDPRLHSLGPVNVPEAVQIEEGWIMGVTARQGQQ